MNFTALASFNRNSGRLRDIVSVLTKYGLADWLSTVELPWIRSWLVSFDGQPLQHLTPEARIRLALTELGPTFIKLGQMLSTRTELIGPALAAELSHLQANTAVDSPDVVRTTLKEELGKSPEELFRHFDLTPIASASIGQVHRATLFDGHDVAVKVQHHGIVEKVTTDLELLSFLAGLAQRHSPQLRPYQPVTLVREFRKSILHELDFTTEKRNLERFAATFADDNDVEIPAPFPALCSRRVLTMQFLDGIKVTDRQPLIDMGIDPNEFARRAADVYMKMIFRDGFYQADQHPGNYVVLPGGVVGVLDCGMVGRLDEETREELEGILLAVIEREASEVTDAVIRICSVPAELDREALRLEVTEFCDEFVGQSLAELDLGEAISQLIGIIRRHRLTLPSACALLLRTLILLEGTSRQLSPEFSLAEVIQPYEKKAVRRRMSPRRLFQKLQRSLRDWDRLVTAFPRDVADILTRLRHGRLEMSHEHHRLEITVNRLVLGILSASLFLCATHLLNREVDTTFGLILNALGLAALGVGGWLAVRVVRAINKADQR